MLEKRISDWHSYSIVLRNGTCNCIPIRSFIEPVLDEFDAVIRRCLHQKHHRKMLQRILNESGIYHEWE